MTRPAKPPHGSPCNSCGLCCAAEPCPLGAAVFRRTAGPCPGLRIVDGRSSCGLVDDPGRYAPAATIAFGADVMSAAAGILIGAGIGCDAQAEGERRDPTLTKRMEKYRKEHARRIALALAAWGVG